MKTRPFALIGVNSDDLDRATAAVKTNNINWRSFQNQHPGKKTKISEDWLLYTWPTIVVLDEEFRVRYRGSDCEIATRIARQLVSKLDGKPISSPGQ